MKVVVNSATVKPVNVVVVVVDVLLAVAITKTDVPGRFVVVGWPGMPSTSVVVDAMNRTVAVPGARREFAYGHKIDPEYVTTCPGRGVREIDWQVTVSTPVAAGNVKIGVAV